MAALDNEPMTARIAGLKARVAFASGQADEARVWLAQGNSARHEPDWSDLDPEGRAFAYQAADWARLVRPGGHLMLSVPAGPKRFGPSDVICVDVLCCKS